MKDKIVFNVKTLTKLIARKMGNTNSNFDCCITPTQMQILDYIINESDGEVYQKDLEDVLNLRRATVSGVLQTMEKNNLISRVISEKDSRVKQIIINEFVKEAFIIEKNKMIELENLLYKDLTEEELIIFNNIILKMKNNLERDDLDA